MITCRKLLKLAQPFHIKLIAGKSGLNRIVSWFHYMENPEYMDWLKGNELILTTGMFIDQSPTELLAFIEALYDHDTAGLIINLSPYIEKVPPEVIALGDFLGYPIFEMSPEIRIIDISECICTAIIESSAKQNMTEHFLFGLIYDKMTISDRTLRKAVQCGYIPEQHYQTVIFSLQHRDSQAKDILDIEMTKAVERRFKTFVTDVNQELLFFSHNSEITLLYPVVSDDSLTGKVTHFIQSFEHKYPAYTLRAGISPKWHQLNQLREHYEKAQQALRFLPVMDKDRRVIRFEDLDVYCLLFSVTSKSELSALYQKTLDPLIRSEDDAYSDLIATLETYIGENSNLQRTAQQLFIHVNTLRYRLKKIEQLLDCDLKNAQDLFSLNLSLKIKKFMDWDTQIEA